MKDTPVVDHSVIYQPFLYGMLLVFAGLLYYGYLTVRFMMTHPEIPYMDIITQLLLWGFFVTITFAHSTYELKEKEIVFTNKNIFRTRVIRVPYKTINGVFPYKLRLLKEVRFRYTHRMYANFDRRPLWSMIYSIPHSSKNARILFKPSDEFLNAFAERCPKRVRISRNEAVTNVYLRERKNKEADRKRIAKMKKERRAEEMQEINQELHVTPAENKTQETPAEKETNQQ
jgi:hypothetical protein